MWWIVAIPAGIAVVVIAVANRHSVGVSLDPLPFRFDLPVYVIAFGSLIVGFVAGIVCAWLSGRKWRRLASTRAREAKSLERELAEIRDREGNRQDRAPRLPSAADAG